MRELFFFILELGIVSLGEVLWSTQSDEVQQVTAVAATESIESGLADGFLDEERSFAVVEPFHHQYDLLSISWLWLLV